MFDQKKYYEEHKQYYRDYYQNHKDKYREAGKRFRENNPDVWRAYARNYHKKKALEEWDQVLGNID